MLIGANDVGYAVSSLECFQNSLLSFFSSYFWQPAILLGAIWGACNCVTYSLIHILIMTQQTDKKVVFQHWFSNDICCLQTSPVHTHARGRRQPRTATAEHGDGFCFSFRRLFCYWSPNCHWIPWNSFCLRIFAHSCLCVCFLITSLLGFLFFVFFFSFVRAFDDWPSMRADEQIIESL